MRTPALYTASKFELRFKMSNNLSIDIVKQQAKTLRKHLADTPQALTHSQSLEIIAKQKGFKDWNTLHAYIGNQPIAKFAVGQRVSGVYLGQNFTGQLLKVGKIAESKRYGITVKFDEAVDVITFKGMSNWRKQVNIIVNQSGETTEKTSNNQPHMILEVV